MSIETESVARERAPAGLEGVAVAETAIGDVRGLEGFYHYRQYSAVELAATRSFEDVWQLEFRGSLPGAKSSEEFRASIASMRALPARLQSLLPEVSQVGAPFDVLRTAISMLGPELGWRPILDVDAATLESQATRLCSVVPTILAAVERHRQGSAPVPARADLSLAANYLWMMHGVEPDPALARAVEQYLILMVDHGFNASTFTARVIASTGADLSAVICGAIGSLSGPLHGGAPSRALDMLDAIGTPDRADSYVRDLVASGGRIMGFGHRVYKTDDPRSLFLHEVARTLHAPLLPFAEEVESAVVSVLGELKPGRDLHTNAEFYAGVVMDACGIDREMFTPTFACARMVGWCAHVLEQAAHNRLIRPSALYVGPPAPQPVPTAG